MRIRHETLKGLALSRFVVLYVSIMISSFVGIGQAEAEILLSESFENAAISNTIWTFKNPSTFGVILDQLKAHSGLGVLQLRYDPGTTGPGFEIHTFSRAVPEVYVRWYEKYSANWKWSGNGEKFLKVQSSSGPGFMLNTEWGSNQPEGQPEGGPMDADFEQNVGSPVGIQGDRWYCMEVQVKADSGGIFRLWIDGVLKSEHTGLNWGTSTWTHLMLSAYYNEGGTTPTGVPQLQFRWVDDLVASTARVGCLPDSGDKTPPGAPKGLRLTTP